MIFATSVKVLETCMAGDKMQRLNSVDEILATVKNVQQAALVCAGLTKNNIADEDEVSFDLFEPGKDKARFTLYILDQPFERKNGQYAAFIVPQGRLANYFNIFKCVYIHSFKKNSTIYSNMYIYL